MAMVGTAATRDQWDDDLSDLLGLDAVRADTTLPTRRHRANLMVFGAVAIAASLSAGIAVQQWRGSDEGGDPARGRTSNPVTATSSGADWLLPRLAGEQRTERSPVRRPTPVAPAPIGDLVGVPVGSAAPAGRVVLPSALEVERTNATDRSVRVRAEQDAAITVAPSDTSSTRAKAIASTAPVEDPVPWRERRDGSEGATVPELVVPLRLLLPGAPATLRRNAPALEGVLLPQRGQTATRPGARGTDRKTEALDALRSLRRQ